MILACIEMTCTIPLGVYSMIMANKGLPLQPYISWSNVHFDFSYIGQIPAVEWRSNSSARISAELTRWLFPVCALLFFVLFGTAGEAQKHYIRAFWWVAQRFGVSPPLPKTSLPSSSRYVFIDTSCAGPLMLTLFSFLQLAIHSKTQPPRIRWLLAGIHLYPLPRPRLQTALHIHDVLLLPRRHRGGLRRRREDSRSLFTDVRHYARHPWSFTQYTRRWTCLVGRPRPRI